MIHLTTFLLKILATIILFYGLTFSIIASFILWDIGIFHIQENAFKRIWEKRIAKKEYQRVSKERLNLKDL